MSIESVRKVTDKSDTHYNLEIEGRVVTTGGWVHTCGHFTYADFVQIVHSFSECHICFTAKAILAEAQDFRTRGVAGISKWK